MIVLAYDHGAREMFQKIKEYLDNLGQEYIECASPELDNADSYVEFAKKANEYVRAGYTGIYGCRFGNGMTIAANKGKGVRGAHCANPKFAEMARKDNNANVCVLPCDCIEFDEAKQIIDVFLATEFLGGRHQKRVEDLDTIE